MSRRMVWSAVAAAMTVVLAASLPVVWTGPASASSSLTWRIHHVDGSAVLNGVSCNPDGSYCIAGDALGNLVWSKQPGAGTAAWHILSLDGPNAILAVDCPVHDGCVAADSAGHTIENEAPLSPGGMWFVARSDGSTAIRTLSCDIGADDCVAMDAKGNTVTTSAPLINEPWTVSRLDGVLAGYWSACPNFADCAVADSAGNLFTTTKAPAGPWQKVKITNVSGFRAITCLSAAFCVASGYSGGRSVVLFSSDLFGGANAWQPVFGIHALPFTSISCPDTSFCAASGAGGIWTSTDPSAPAPTWVKTSVDAPHLITSVSCPTASLCIAADTAGNVIAGTPAA